MFCHLDSKSSGACNFIGTFALKLRNKSQNLIINMTQHVASQTRRKKVLGLEHTNGSLVI